MHCFTRVAAFALASLVTLVGCDQSKDKATADAGAKQGGDAGGVLVYIAKNTGNPYFEPLIQGFNDAASENGFTARTQSPASADATSQMGIIKDQVQQKVKAIAISPNSTDALDAVLDEAIKKGVPVVTVDSDLPTTRTIARLACSPSTRNRSARDRSNCSAHSSTTRASSPS